MRLLNLNLGRGLRKLILLLGAWETGENSIFFVFLFFFYENFILKLNIIEGIYN